MDRIYHLKIRMIQHSLARNQEHCNPLLDNKEFEKQWICAQKFIDNNEITKNKKPF
jgi:hypothetical protein